MKKCLFCEKPHDRQKYCSRSCGQHHRYALRLESGEKKYGGTSARTCRVCLAVFTAVTAVYCSDKCRNSVSEERKKDGVRDYTPSRLQKEPSQMDFSNAVYRRKS